MSKLTKEQIEQDTDLKLQEIEITFLKKELKLKDEYIKYLEGALDDIYDKLLHKKGQN